MAITVTSLQTIVSTGASATQSSTLATTLTITPNPLTTAFQPPSYRTQSYLSNCQTDAVSGTLPCFVSVYPEGVCDSNGQSCYPPVPGVLDNTYLYSPGLSCPSGWSTAWKEVRTPTGEDEETTAHCCPTLTVTTYGIYSTWCEGVVTAGDETMIVNGLSQCPSSTTAFTFGPDNAVQLTWVNVDSSTMSVSGNAAPGATELHGSTAFDTPWAAVPPQHAGANMPPAHGGGLPGPGEVSTSNGYHQLQGTFERGQGVMDNSRQNTPVDLVGRGAGGRGVSAGEGERVVACVECPPHAACLEKMKNLKMSGLAAPICKLVQKMRVDELRAGARFQFILSLTATLGVTPLCLSPVMAFAFATRSLGVTTIFTSMSYIVLLATPLSVLFQSIQSLMAAFTCLDRIQVFLEKANRHDFRVATSSTQKDRTRTTDTLEVTKGSENIVPPSHAIEISGGCFAWSSDRYVLVVDGRLPMALSNMSLYVFSSLGQAAVIATSSPYLAITYPFLLGILYGAQKFYLRTSRQMRILDLETKGPLYSHFIDTLKGLATIRAFGWVSENTYLNRTYLDTSQRPAYLLAIIQHWLGFVLRLTVAVLAVAIVTLSMQLGSNTAFTGASLVTLMSFAEGLMYVITIYTLLETSIGAVSRLKSFSEKVKPEGDGDGTCLPPPFWPQGGVRLNKVSATYADIGNGSPAPSHSNAIGAGNVISDSADIERHPLALKNLSLVIRPGEKVAICGRSGSGKSSIVSLLLRLLDPLPTCAGSVVIDDTPLQLIDRTTLRERILTIPQDVVFLPEGSSFQMNLDPFGASSEEDCEAALNSVGLRNLVEEHGGLAAGMDLVMLSQGQKQLFNLARALLRHMARAREFRSSYGDTGAVQRGVLLLDEFSSCVDNDTDRAMQKIIREEFVDYTVIMVSHRLDVVMEFDTVVMMDAGSIVEIGGLRH